MALVSLGYVAMAYIVTAYVVMAIIDRESKNSKISKFLHTPPARAPAHVCAFVRACMHEYVTFAHWNLLACMHGCVPVCSVARMRMVTYICVRVRECARTLAQSHGDASSQAARRAQLKPRFGLGRLGRRWMASEVGGWIDQVNSVPTWPVH